MPVTIPATGAGTATPTVATDQVGGQEYQLVKLDLGALGSSQPVYVAVPVGGSDGTLQRQLLTDSMGRLRVRVDRMPALEVDGDNLTIQVEPGEGKFTVQGSSNAIPVPVSVVPSIQSGFGWSPQAFFAQTTSVQTLKNAPGEIGAYYFFNPNTSVAYVQLFDTLGTVTLGTTVPKWSLGIPASSAANLHITGGLSFMTGIKLACTTTATGNTAPSTGLDLNFAYR